MERIKDFKMRTRGMDYHLNFEILPMKGSLTTVLNEKAYPLLLREDSYNNVVVWLTGEPKIHLYLWSSRKSNQGAN